MNRLRIAPALLLAAILASAAAASPIRLADTHEQFPPARPPPARPASATPSIRATRVIEVRTLDVMRAARELRSALDAAEREGAARIELRLTARSWRRDVIAAMADATAGAAVPVHAAVEGGAGALLLALCAPTREIQPGGRLIIRPGDEAADLAPKAALRDADEAILRHVRRSLGERGGHADVAAYLLAPVSPAWLVTSDAGARVVRDEPSPGVAGVAVRPLRMPGRDAFELDAAALMDLRWLGAPAASRDGRGPPRTPSADRPARTIEVNLDHAQARVLEHLARADDLLREADLLLSLPKPTERRVAPAEYRRRGSRAADVLEQARGEVNAAIALLADIPEAARRPAPDQVPSSPAAHEARWRALVQRRLDAASRHEAEAALYRKQ